MSSLIKHIGCLVVSKLDVPYIKTKMGGLLPANPKSKVRAGIFNYLGNLKAKEYIQLFNNSSCDVAYGQQRCGLVCKASEAF